MSNCRFCGTPLEQESSFCANCGYNASTDTIDVQLKQHMELAKKAKGKKESGRKQLIGPGVKKFIFIGLALTLFSLLYKYNFDINLVGAELKYIFTMVRTGKIIQLWKSDEKGNKLDKVIELMDVRSFRAPKDLAKYKNLVIEGIFFDPEGSFIIINGDVVPEGGTFKNAKVKKINSDSVELIIDGAVKVLEANQSIPLPKK